MNLLDWLSRRTATASVLILCAAALLAMMAGLLGGNIITHSSMFNTVWADGFAAELAKGHWYPRYLPDVNDGRGSPVFYFYAPLPFYISAPFVWLTGHAPLAVVMASTVMLALSGVAAYLFLREIAGARHALALALVYMLLPYHLSIDIWVRGAFGEQATFIFLPFALFCLHRMLQDARYTAGLALATAGQVVSHLPSAMIYAVILAGFSLWMAWCNTSWRLLILAKLAGASGVLLSTLYLLPAYAGQAFISPRFWGGFSPENYYLPQFNGPFDIMLLLAFVPQAVAIALVSRVLWRNGASAAAKPWLVLAGVIALFVSPLAIPFWHYVTPLRMIQFPWRSLAAFELAVVSLMAIALRAQTPGVDRMVRLVVTGLVITGAAMGFLRHSASPEQGAPLRMAESVEAHLVGLKSDALEYLPPCTEVLDRHLLRPPSDGLLLDDYRTNPQPAGTINTFYYPFLRFTAGGQELQTHCHDSSGLAAVEGGQVPAAPVTITAQPLPIETTASWLSLAGLLAVAALFMAGGILNRKRERQIA